MAREFSKTHDAKPDDQLWSELPRSGCNKAAAVASDNIAVEVVTSEFEDARWCFTSNHPRYGDDARDLGFGGVKSRLPRMARMRSCSLPSRCASGPWLTGKSIAIK
jgi:hypothetical protein